MALLPGLQKISLVTITDSQPLPRVDEALDALSGSAWFSTMDLQRGYWQIELEESDLEKTAFSGLYQFKVMRKQKMMILHCVVQRVHISMIHYDCVVQSLFPLYQIFIIIMIMII